MYPRETIAAFDAYLEERQLKLDAVVVGGAALSLLGVTDRQTRDVDVLHPDLPSDVVEAAQEFAKAESKDGRPLDKDWLNNGPAGLKGLLPEGWRERQVLAYQGASVHLMALGRSDLLKTKLFALCDRGTDLPDCVALAPTILELDEAGPWLAEQDTNPGWADHVNETLADLQRRVHDGV